MKYFFSALRLLAGCRAAVFKKEGCPAFGPEGAQALERELVEGQLSLRAMGLLLAVLLAGCTTYAAPLPRAYSRPTPLGFGLYVTPDPTQNPIDPPERFTGYHTAIDFEILPGEEDDTIAVYAICAGKIVFSGFSEGYGGLVTQFCTIDEQDVTVIYGHLAVDSLIESGIVAETGAKLGILGAARSSDTDGSRKHLHLGIAKGHGSEVRGYVQSEAELDLFLDPREILD